MDSCDIRAIHRSNDSSDLSSIIPTSRSPIRLRPLQSHHGWPSTSSRKLCQSAFEQSKRLKQNISTRFHKTNTAALLCRQSSATTSAGVAAVSPCLRRIRLIYVATSRGNRLLILIKHGGNQSPYVEIETNRLGVSFHHHTGPLFSTIRPCLMKRALTRTCSINM